MNPGNFRKIVKQISTEPTYWVACIGYVEEGGAGRTLL
jgi:hypothetical protein